MARVRVRAAGLVLGSALALAAGCGGGGGGGGTGGGTSGGPPRDVQVSWAANREAAVNGPGGGYRVYHGTTRGFAVATASFVDVPHDGATGATPTSATINALSPGTHYIKVVAYSALNPPGGTGGSASAPSAEVSVTVR